MKILIGFCLQLGAGVEMKEDPTAFPEFMGPQGVLSALGRAPDSARSPVTLRSLPTAQNSWLARRHRQVSGPLCLSVPVTLHRNLIDRGQSLGPEC